MSIRAVAYVKELKACTDGAELSAEQKLLLMVLADYHHPETRVAWPSLPVLASEALVSEDSARRYLRYLERHCVLMTLHPERQGRGKVTRYVFLALDAPEELRRRLGELEKGSQSATLFSGPERVAEGWQNQPKRVAEGWQNGGHHKEEPRTKSNLEPESANCEKADQETRSPEGGDFGAARQVWPLVLNRLLRGGFDRHECDTWLRPARAVAVVEGWLHLSWPRRDFVAVVERYRARMDTECQALGLGGVILQVDEQRAGEQRLGA